MGPGKCGSPPPWQAFLFLAALPCSCHLLSEELQSRGGSRLWVWAAAPGLKGQGAPADHLQGAGSHHSGASPVLGQQAGQSYNQGPLGSHLPSALSLLSPGETQQTESGGLGVAEEQDPNSTPRPPLVPSLPGPTLPAAEQN